MQSAARLQIMMKQRQKRNKKLRPLPGMALATHVSISCKSMAKKTERASACRNTGSDTTRWCSRCNFSPDSDCFLSDADWAVGSDAMSSVYNCASSRGGKKRANCEVHDANDLTAVA